MTKNPKGRLVFINCNEWMDYTTESENRLESLELLSFITDRKNDRIEIITSDCNSYVRFRKFYKQTLFRLGFTNFDSIHLNIDNLSNMEVLSRLRAAQVVLFVGNQSQLYFLVKDTQIFNVLHEKYRNEDRFTIAGVCKGALCIPGKMISNCPYENTPRKCLELQQGLGFLNNCIVDTQYSQKISYNKLAYTVVKHHDLLGIGLGSGTVLIVQNGFVGVCKGDGTIMLVNARETKRVRKNFRNPNRSFYESNLKGLVMIDGSIVNLHSGGIYEE
jgi:cyanophycinase